MKILYIDLNIHYHNPTRNLIPALLKSIGEVYFFGPGYQSRYILEKGIKKFYDNYAPFDIIATNEHLIFSQEKIKKYPDILLKSYRKNYFFQFQEDLFLTFFKEAYNFFTESKIIKLIFMLESDYYNFSDYQIKILKELDAFIVGFGKTLISPKKELKDINKEKFYKLVNDNWYNFVVDNNKIIELPHFVGENEFYFNSLDSRSFDFSIPGTDYFYRKKIKKILKKQKRLNIFKTKFWTVMYSTARKFGLKPDGKPLSMRFYNVYFRTLLEKTKYVFTCGSALNWPLRKFFEIPAAGALLIAKPFKNAHHFGFIDKETYLKVEIDNILNIIEWANRNEEEAQRIATNGQNMVWNLHSLNARGLQLKKVLSTIVRGKFKQCYWKRGEFIVEENGRSQGKS